MTITQVLAGQKAKMVGHLQEERVCQWLNQNYSGNHILHAGSKTKIDILNESLQIGYSLKSVSKNHTQCHLTSTKRWCEFFDLPTDLCNWFNLFFGIPGEDVSNGKSRQHRLTKEEIDHELNDLALSWFNQNKIAVFDVILRKGMNDTPVDYLIWYQKSTKQIDLHKLDDLEKMVYNGEWILNSTTLHFVVNNQQKMFHLQMKGSGKKYTSGYHGLMFHLYKCF
jgi:hypothetical protein